MVQIKINHEPLEHLEDAEERKLYIKNFKNNALEIFKNADGFIYFNYISSFNQFDIEKTNLDDEILRLGIMTISQRFPHSMIA